MDKCECYKWGQRFECRYYEDGRPFGIMVGYNYCTGTKECDACSCGGDRTKCDFYPDVKMKALYKLKGIKTNADRIRHMTNEELAKFINDDVPWDKICSGCEWHYSECDDNEICKSKLLKWLGKEVEV